MKIGNQGIKLSLFEENMIVYIKQEDLYIMRTEKWLDTKSIYKNQLCLYPLV